MLKNFQNSRLDRDDYVIVNTKNILDDFEKNFRRKQEIDSLGSPYDYCSIMHYATHAFSKNNLPTIELKPGKTGCEELTDIPFGQIESPSTLDIMQLHQLYQCTTGPRTVTELENDLCNNNCKCWNGASGCNNDNECMGDLICEVNVCQPKKINSPQTPKPSPVKTLPPTISPRPSSTPSTAPTIYVTPLETFMICRSGFVNVMNLSRIYNKLFEFSHINFLF